ncbi:MAG: hypothetical protein HQL87_14685, partial [Magnetococcales bacterium]|nr:hypothetical protein [Magnetococcales bacterium]
AAGVGAAGSGVDAENRLQVSIAAFVDGDGANGIQAGSVSLLAQDPSSITALAGAAAMAAALGGAAGVSVSVGVSLACNRIDNSVLAYISNADQGITVQQAGDLTILASETAQIQTLSAAAAVAAAFAGAAGVGLSGAGASALNIILGDVQAFVLNSVIHTTSVTQNGGVQAGDVTIHAVNQSHIDASILVASLAAAGGGAVGVGASIGMAIARNYIGYDPYANVGYTYLAGVNNPGVLHTGDVVRLGDGTGIRAGETYRYIGSDPLYAKEVSKDGELANLLLTQDYANRDLWQQVINTTPGTVAAFVTGSSMAAQGTVTVLAESHQAIDAQVFSGSVAISAGFAAVSLSGAGGSAENRMDTTVSAYLSSGASIYAGGDLKVRALDTSVIDTNVAAASVAAAFGIGGAAALGVAVADNVIANTVEAYVAHVGALSTGGNVLIEANELATIQATAQATAAAAGLVSLAGGGAYAGGVVSTVTHALVNDSQLLLGGNLSVLATSQTGATADLEATAASIGLIAAAASGTVTKLTVNPAVTAQITASVVHAVDVTITATGYQTALAETQAISVSTGASLGASLALLTDAAQVTAGLGDGVTLQAQTLNMQTNSQDLVNAQSFAASGGIFAGIAGAAAKLTLASNALVTMGNNNQVVVETLYVRSSHAQTFDAQAKNLAVGILAGSGALVLNTVSSAANVALGTGNTVTAASITLLAANQSTKDRYANDNNLSSASAGLIGLSALSSTSVIGTSANPFSAVINIGAGTTLAATGNTAQPGSMTIEASTNVYAVDSVRVEGVAGLSLSIANANLATTTNAAVNVEGAQLLNDSGDITLTAKTDARLNPSTNLFSAAVISGGASIATGSVSANNSVHVDNSLIKARNVNLYAGRNAFGVSNLLDGNATADMALVSLYGLGVPVPTMSINEVNQVVLSGNTALKAMEDVELVAKKGQASNEDGTRGKTAGLVVSLSLIPYAVDVPNGATESSSNQVLVGSNVLVDAGIFNKALLQVLPMRVNGEQQLDPTRLGTELTAAEKTALGLDVDQHYEYAALPVDHIALSMSVGNLVKVVAGAAVGGTPDAYYEYNPTGGGTDVNLLLDQQNYTDRSTWTAVTVLADTGVVNAVKSTTRVSHDGNVYLYMGDNKSLDLSTQTYDQKDNWTELAVYNSDIGSSFAAQLQGKLYVIKQQDVALPTLVYANIGNKLFEQREQVEGWITSQSSNAEAVARYQAELDTINQTLTDLGLGQSINGQTLVQASFDAFFVNLPNLYASPGSVFIQADNAESNALTGMIGQQLVARSGADINILNKTPFGLQVNDLGISADQRTDVVNGQLVSLTPGHVYLNDVRLDSTAGSSSTGQIQVVQAGYPSAAYDLTVPSIPQDVYVIGNVVNQSGALILKNLDGSINVSGQILAGSISLAAKGNFNLSSDAWYHSNGDPRQYVDYTSVFDTQVYNKNGTSDSLTFGSLSAPGMAGLNAAIHNQNTTRVLAEGDISIQARYINIDGLVQSGVENYSLTIDSSFAPKASTGFTDALGNTIAGIRYGEPDVPVSGFFDANSGTIMLDPIVANGGHISLTGQILSTGNGQLRVASGYASVNITNNSQYQLSVGTIDVSKDRVGTITVTDSTTLAREVYTVKDGIVTQQAYQGNLVPASGPDDIASIVYTPGASSTHSASETLSYQPTPGQYYTWVDGQEMTKVVIKTYEQNSFNLLGFEWDALAADSSAISTDVQTRDKSPLLESEVVSTLAGDPYAYSISFMEQNDKAVSVVKDVTLVANVTGLNLSDPTVLYGISPIKLYEYVGSASKVDLTTANFTDTTNWVDSGQTVAGYLGAVSWANSTNQKYLSTFENVTTTTNTWTTGGGWLRKQTVHTVTTTVTGIKDYYTNNLRADYPIAVSFLQGASAPEINIHTPGTLLLNGSISLGGDPNAVGVQVPAPDPDPFGPNPVPSQGGISLGSDTLQVGDNVVISGAAPKISSNGSVSVKLENAWGVLNVKAKGDINITALKNDNHGTLHLGTILADGSITVKAMDALDLYNVRAMTDVTLQAGDGINGLNGVIVGNVVTLDGGAGSIVARFDSGNHAPGGVVATATGDIGLEELAGDLNLLSSQTPDTVASVSSLHGNVTLMVDAGSIVNMAHTGLNSANDGTLDPRLQSLVDQGLVSADQVQYLLSPELMAKLYPHAALPGYTPSTGADPLDIQGVNVTLVTDANDTVGLSSPLMQIQMPDTGLSGLTDAARRALSLARPQDIQQVNYAVYRFIGNAATLSLADGTTFANANLWQKVTQDYSSVMPTQASTLDGTVHLQTGDLVTDKYVIESLTLQTWAPVTLQASGILNVTRSR